MSILGLLMLALLTLTDPSGDAFGDGELVAPTSPVYANSAIFDIHELHVEHAGGEGPLRPAEVRLSLAEVQLDPDMPSGFAGPIFDVYIDTGEGGFEATLSGPDMLMPPNSGWEHAVRIGPDAAYAVSHLQAVSPPETSVDGEGTDQVAAAPPELIETLPDGTQLERVPLTVVIDGSTLRVALPWPLPAQFFAYAVSGVHDSFSASGWRQLAQASSPWAFSGGQQAVPVIDLLANSQAEQQRALREGVLPRVGGTSARGWPWLLLMGAGVALSIYGLLQRRSSPAPVTEPGPRPKRPAGGERPARGELRTGLPPEEPATAEGAIAAAPEAAPEAAAEAVAETVVSEEPSPPPLAAQLGKLVAADRAAIGRAVVEPTPALEHAEEPTPVLAPAPASEANPPAEPAGQVPAAMLSEVPLEPARVDPFARLVFDAEAEDKSATEADADPLEHARIWGKRNTPGSLKIESVSEATDASEAAGSAVDVAAPAADDGEREQS